VVRCHDGGALSRAGTDSPVLSRRSVARVRTAVRAVEVQPRPVGGARHRTADRRYRRHTGFALSPSHHRPEVLPEAMGSAFELFLSALANRDVRAFRVRAFSNRLSGRPSAEV